jgi:uncharacterized phiE125 gp8 family phage protein
MNATLITAPTLEPVTVQEARDHLRVTGTDEYAYIANLVVSARQEMEDWTRRAIMTQTWDYFLEAFPLGNAITIPFGNLQNVPLTQYVKYKDVAGTETTMTITTDYLVETNGEGFGRIVLPYSCTWPMGPFYPSNPIKIRFVCGWTTQALVPMKLKQAILMRIAEMYEMRGESTVGSTVATNRTAENLIQSLRLWGSF